MKRKSDAERDSGWRGKDALESEITGYIELGMGKEALRAAAQVLKQKQPTLGDVAEAICAIGLFSNVPLKKWQPEIEGLIARLSKRRRHQLRETFLIHFASRACRKVCVWGH